MSNKQAGPSLIHVPIRFSTVEPGVYRCASPTAAQIPFLGTLNLKTVISLTAEHPIRELLQFTRSSEIDFLHLGTTMWKPLMDWRPIRDEIVKATLEILLDVRNHPVLLIDPLGIHQTGCVVGALRMLQGWNFASALVEYRSHSGPLKHRFNDEQYIELFDPDLVNVPIEEHLPDWYDVGREEAEDTDYEEDEIAIKREADGVVTAAEPLGVSEVTMAEGPDARPNPQTAILGVG